MTGLKIAPLKIALAQIGPTVGALRSTDGYRGNKDIILDAWRAAQVAGADLVVTPEMALVGYPAKDLVQRRDLLTEAKLVLEELAAETANGPALLVGAPLCDGTRVYNTAFLLDGGRIVATIRKHELPNYGPFDDKRNFTPGGFADPVTLRGIKLGVMICEDCWFPEVAGNLHAHGAEILLVMNASPFQRGKHRMRLQDVATRRVYETQLPFLYVNQCTAIDGLPFDGNSFVMNADGEIALQMAEWQRGLAVAQFERTAQGWACQAGEIAPARDDLESIYRGLMFGTRDYMRQNRFDSVVLGLSGGIDSALVATIAADALGADKILALRLPSQYSSQHSLDDAKTLAQTLGCILQTIPIGDLVSQYSKTMQDFAAPDDNPIAEENIQARIRGNVIMYFSNKSAKPILPLSTGNKSEIAVGYSTLYGDMCGGFNPLKDVWKTMVYDLARWRNAHCPDDLLGPRGIVIPQNTLDKPPSAELKPGQTDQDSLPSYTVLDDILQRLVEQGQTRAEIIAAGHAAETVDRLWALVNRAEYKRQQAAPGVDISGGEFTREYRMPISNHFGPRQLQGQLRRKP